MKWGPGDLADAQQVQRILEKIPAECADRHIPVAFSSTCATYAAVGDGTTDDTSAIQAAEVKE